MSQTNEVAPGYDNETFEKDLQEILESTPPLNNCSETVQSGLSRVDTGSSQDMSQSEIYSSTRPTTLPPVSAAPVTTDVALNTPHNNGDFIPKSSASNTSPNTKLEVIKAWGVSTYKCTTQYLKERFGKATRTVDLELDLQVEVLRDTQKKYTNVLRLARTLVSHFGHVVQTQRALADSFGELSQKCEELQDEFSYNTQTQRTLVKNGENLLGALNFFTTSVNTLVNKTMEDTVLTIRLYEAARLEFDAYKSDLDSLTFNPSESTPPHKVTDAKQKYEEQKNKYERLRNDVAIKLKFLEENKVKVMHKQLLLFHNAMSAYFSGNETALSATLQQFNIKLTTPNASSPSWLEN